MTDEVTVDFKWQIMERDTDQFIANRTSEAPEMTAAFKEFCEEGDLYGGQSDLNSFLLSWEEDWDISYGIYGESDLDFAWTFTGGWGGSSSFLTRQLDYIVFYAQGDCYVGIIDSRWNEKVEIKFCENDEAMADFSTVEAFHEVGWATNYIQYGWEDSDGSGLGSALTRAVYLEPDDELPDDDEETAYWVCDHETLEDGLYYMGTACKFNP